MGDVVAYNSTKSNDAPMKATDNPLNSIVIKIPIILQSKNAAIPTSNIATDNIYFIRYLISLFIDYYNDLLAKSSAFNVVPLDYANLKITSGETREYALTLSLYEKSKNYVSTMNLVFHINSQNVISLIKSENAVQNNPTKILPKAVLKEYHNFADTSLLITQEDISAYEEQLKNMQNEQDIYLCYGSSNINAYSADECKKLGGVWDREVKEDNECPYYNANKNYPNNRGIAKNGYCEIPSGAQLVGFRFLTDEDKMLCYNCKTDLIGNGTLGKCCKSQLNDPNFITPDYKFPGDQLDRQHNADYFTRKGFQVL